MSKLYVGSINLDKIDESKIYNGDKGRWVNVSFWVNDQIDQYGNHASVQQTTEKGEPKIYLGNLKEHRKV